MKTPGGITGSAFTTSKMSPLAELRRFQSFSAASTSANRLSPQKPWRSLR